MQSNWKMTTSAQLMARRWPLKLARKLEEAHNTFLPHLPDSNRSRPQAERDGAGPDYPRAESARNSQSPASLQRASSVLSPAEPAASGVVRGRGGRLLCSAPGRAAGRAAGAQLTWSRAGSRAAASGAPGRSPAR